MIDISNRDSLSSRLIHSSKSKQTYEFMMFKRFERPMCEALKVSDRLGGNSKYGQKARYYVFPRSLKNMGHFEKKYVTRF